MRTTTWQFKKDMEKALTKVRFEGLSGAGETSESEGELEAASSSDEGEETRLMVARQNRKGKKSGGFQSMGLSKAVFSGVMKKGYRVPTPIQRKCVPLIMDGKDVVAMARTGSGKTAAFLVPMFEQLKTHSAKIGARAIILSPTRELATQTMKFTKELGRFTDLRASLVLGGERMEDQFAAMHENPDIILATPGRLLHLLVEMDLQLSSVQFVVFDEADRLFEMGFAEQLQEILRKLPEARQTLLFSATLPKMLVEFARAGLKDPVLVRLDVDSKLSEQLKLSFFAARQDDKPAILLSLLRNILPTNEQTVVFTATKHHVEYLRELLQAVGIDASFIYSSLDQTARKINIAKFVNKKTKIMLVTDIAARGIDIPMLDNVINYNFPAKPKLFVHRVGRVARAGRSGVAFSLVSQDELPYLLDLHLFLSQSIKLAGSSTEPTGLYGSVPQSVIDEEDEFLRKIHDTSSDLSSAQKVAENALKQFVRSRPPPAPESVKRSKRLPKVIPVHPVFQELCCSSVQECGSAQFLDGLRAYKPSQTIFEVNSTTRTVAKEVMKSKRVQHSEVILAAKKKSTSDDVHGDDLKSHDLPAGSHEPSTADDLAGFKTEQSLKKKGKKRSKDVNYLHYTPPDVHSEKGLSLGGGFEKAVSGAVLDLEGDEARDTRKRKSMLKWDRKRKKFVNESGKDGSKKIKTESGTYIAASFKSNAYREWMDKHRIESTLTGTENDSTTGATPGNYRGIGTRGSRGKGRSGTRGRGGSRNGRGGDHVMESDERGGPFNQDGRGQGRRGRGRGRGRGVADLRTRAEILKKRQTRDKQQNRRKMKVKRQTTVSKKKKH